MNFGYLKIFKYISFVSSHNISVINLDAASSFSAFIEFDSICQLDVLLF